MKSYERILRELGPCVRRDVPMSAYTTFRIGGPADLFIEPETEEQLMLALRLLDEEGLDRFVVGNGSNLLVSDSGYRGAVIRLAEKFSDLAIRGTHLRALAGASLAAAANRSVSRGLQGLEWASGIPGTVGGAVAMNAGAYGGEIRQVLTRVRLIRNGVLCDHDVSSDELGYRTSAFAYPDAVVVAAEMDLLPDPDGGAALRRREYNAARRAKQPLEFPSAGSTFKRPPGRYAGALIEQAGLKGFSVGGASVSPKHAGFVVSDGSATARDVYTLIGEVQKRVLAHSGVLLEPEVKLIGDFS
ncbi:MAG: UDP-N-acetylmuramate dehydrogenase [Eubacteriales bacterium]|nr:UDP-N-acetylmuramate dehydrogenase [Eubacteriales bacterium]